MGEFAKSFRDLDVEVFESGAYVSYSACGMPYYLAGEIAEISSLHANATDFAKARSLDLHVNSRVTSVNVKDKTVTYQGRDGTAETGYDGLILATGVRPIQLPLFSPHTPEEGAFTLRGIEDVIQIDAALFVYGKP